MVGLLVDVSPYRFAREFVCVALRQNSCLWLPRYYIIGLRLIQTRKSPVEICIKRIPVTTPSQPLCAGPSGPGIPAEGLW